MPLFDASAQGILKRGLVMIALIVPSVLTTCKLLALRNLNLLLRKYDEIVPIAGGL